MRWFVLILGAVIAIAALVWIIGTMLPTRHVAAVRVLIPQPPARVFDAIADVEHAAAWRSDLKRVEVLSGADQPLRWRESTSFGDLTMAREEATPPSRLVNRIDDPGQPFGGRWIHELAPEQDGTLLTITEEGDVYNPFFRFMSRYVFGHYRTLENYAADLARHLGAGAAPAVQRAHAGR